MRVASGMPRCVFPRIPRQPIFSQSACWGNLSLGEGHLEENFLAPREAFCRDKCLGVPDRNVGFMGVTLRQVQGVSPELGSRLRGPRSTWI